MKFHGYKEKQTKQISILVLVNYYNKSNEYHYNKKDYSYYIIFLLSASINKHVCILFWT